MKKFLSFITLLFMMLIFHNEVINGVKDGLILWYQTLIPALLPFIIITNALSETHSYEIIVSLIGNHFTNIYVIITFILGNLCGYPIGGKIMNDFVEQGYISPDNANSFLSVSSQASPMFLLGFVYPMLKKTAIPLYIFLLLIYIPTIILFIYKYTLYSYQYRKNNIPSTIRSVTLCSDNKLYSSSKNIDHQSAANLTNTFLHAVNIMVIIGIYVIIFSVLQSVIFPLTHSILSKCVLSFLEITTGLYRIQHMPLSENIYTCLILSLSSFGGLCSAFQIDGVLTYKDSTIKKYLQDKIILSTGTFLLTYLYMILRFSSPS